MLTRNDLLARFSHIANLNQDGVHLASLAGSTSEQFVARLAPKAQAIVASQLSDAVQLLLEGEVDAVVADFETCTLAHLQHPEAGLDSLRQPLTVEPMGIAIPPEDTLLANLLENYLGALRLTGGLERIRKFWL